MKRTLPPRADLARLDRVDLLNRLRVAEKALTFYAKASNWCNDDWGIPSVHREYANAGKKALQALRRIRK